MAAEADKKLRLIGHKGADAIAPGNTVASFEAAVAAGVDTIEFDVVWLRDAQLPLEQREVLVLRIWAELSFPEIAEVLEIGVDTAASRHRYALAALRRIMPVNPLQ